MVKPTIVRAVAVHNRLNEMKVFVKASFQWRGIEKLMKKPTNTVFVGRSIELLNVSAGTWNR
jgi:hypothetical protein